MRLSLSLALVCGVGSLAHGARAARPFTPEELLQTRRLDDPQISPDAKWVAFTVRQKSLAENRDVKYVWLAPLAGGPSRQFTRDGRSEHPRWSPDGKQLLVERGGDAPQLWLYDLAAGGDPRQLTSLWGGAEAGLFSPDGKLVAYTTEVFPSCAGDGPAIDACDRARAEEREKTKVKARIVDRLLARHWSEWKDGKRTHVFVQPVSGGPARDLTPGDADWPTWRLHGADDIAFTPDGVEVIVSAKPAAREAWSTNGDLWSIPVAGGPPRNLTADNLGDDAQPRLSPDGRYVAWVSQARDGYESDQWKLKLMDRKTGKISVIGDFDDDVGTFFWRRDGNGLVASVLQRGRTVLNTVSLDGKVARYSELPAGADFALAPDGSVAFVGSGMVRPPELYRLSPRGAPQKLTAFNDEQYRDVAMPPPPEEIWVTARDGARVHSWVLKPPGLPAGQKAPLVVLIHGGPQSTWQDVWGMRWSQAAFAARGFVVLAPNPRGSTEELWFPEFELGGPYWEKPEAYRKWSPSAYAQNFKTLTLVIQGELDFRVATEQALGMFTALQRRGVESRLLYFPDEGHWVLKPRNSQLWYRTVLDWIDAHAGAGALAGRKSP